MAKHWNQFRGSSIGNRHLRQILRLVCDSGKLRVKLRRQVVVACQIVNSTPSDIVTLSRPNFRLCCRKCIQEAETTQLNAPESIASLVEPSAAGSQLDSRAAHLSFLCQQVQPVTISDII